VLICDPCGLLGQTHTRNLPVLGVAAAEDNFDNDLVFAGFRDVAVDDVDLGASGDESFLHVF
jgi:hypothetical protein